MTRRQRGSIVRGIVRGDRRGAISLGPGTTHGTVAVGAADRHAPNDAPTRGSYRVEDRPRKSREDGDRAASKTRRLRSNDVPTAGLPDGVLFCDATHPAALVKAGAEGQEVPTAALPGGVLFCNATRSAALVKP